MRKNYVAELNRYISYVERNICPQTYLTKAIDKLCWCKKFKKLTEDEFNEIADRILFIQENKPML